MENMSEKVKNNKWLIYLLMLIVLLLLAATGYLLIFNKSITEKEDNCIDVIEYTVDSPIVEKLYSYISLIDTSNIREASNFWNSITEEEKSIIYMDDLSDSIKNELGYALMSSEGKTIMECSEVNYDSDNTNSVDCGFLNEDNSHTSYTYKIIESYLKKSVENIFGVGSYTVDGFGTYFDGYVYSEDNQSYYYVSGVGGNTGSTLYTSLEDVSNTSIELTLKIKVYTNYVEDISDAETIGTYNCLYKLDNNGYYLYSIEKI